VTRTTLLQGVVSAGALALSTLAVSESAGPLRSPAELARFDFRAPPPARWELPSSLREISGLAVDSAGRVFAHDDERAIIYQLDPAARRIVKRFSFGRPAAHGDFEAIAVVGQQLILTTSDGVLYAGREGDDGEAVPFTVQATGTGRLCEIEGMVYAPGDRALLFACKEPRIRTLHGHFAVLRWSLERKALDPRPRLFLPLANLTRDLGVPGFHPSEMVRLARSGHYLVLASRERAIVELTETGAVVAVARLRHREHPQAEGLAIAKDGALLVADEGGSGRGTVSVYRPR
jgi:uncharacterized protein YjiK